MKKFGIICLMPDIVLNYHQELQLKLVSQFGLSANINVPAHITIKYPFEVEDTNEIEKIVQEFCDTQVKTEWVLQGFDRFINNDNNVFFIDVTAPAETRFAHSKFLDRLRKIGWMQWGQFDTADLHYHVTLAARGLTVDNFDAVWSFLDQQEKPNFKVFFDNLAFVQIEENSGFIYKTFRFRN